MNKTQKASVVNNNCSSQLNTHQPPSYIFTKPNMDTQPFTLKNNNLKTHNNPKTFSIKQSINQDIVNNSHLSDMFILLFDIHYLFAKCSFVIKEHEGSDISDYNAASNLSKHNCKKKIENKKITPP